MGTMANSAARITPRSASAPIGSPGSMRLNFGATQWKASGGTIANIKFAVLYLSGPSATAKKLICYSQLSTAAFSLTNQNTLTVTPAATGVFNLT